MGNDVTEGGFWRYFEDHPEDNAKFNSTMAAKSQVVVPLVVTAYDFESLTRIVDVGGGRGHLLDAIINSTVKPTGVLFDQPHVVREAAPISTDRLQVLGGDFFTDTLPEADAYVLMEVIHDWDDEHAERILRTVRNAAPAGSKILLVEAMMPDAPGPAGLQPWMSSCSICWEDGSVVYRNLQSCSISAVLTKSEKFRWSRPLYCSRQIRVGVMPSHIANLPDFP
jgi:hypothetical protein